jgi:cytidylate kinase
MSIQCEKVNNSLNVPICVCGLAGSGKSTLAKRLAQNYQLIYLSGGDALKALAEQEGYHPLIEGWWESADGIRFLEHRRKYPRFDRKVDNILLERAQQGGVVLDSRTMPWLLKTGFKIWLDASREKRAERIAERDGTTVKKALKALAKKEKQTIFIYKKLYGFNLGDDFSPFHVILDTDYLNANEVFQVFCKVIDNLLFTQNNGD